MFCKFRNTSLSTIEKLFEDCKLKLDLADIESFAIETVVVSLKISLFYRDLYRGSLVYVVSLGFSGIKFFETCHSFL